MPANRYPPLSRTFHSFTIHSQSHNRRATYGCYAFQFNAVLAPLKMIVPHISTWVEKPCFRSGFRIHTRLKVELKPITAYTSQCQIIQRCLTIRCKWDNMVNCHSNHNFLLGLTVFAAFIGTLNDCLPQMFRDVRHQETSLSIFSMSYPRRFKITSASERSSIW